MNDGQSGPKTVIIAGIHGDEGLGVQVLEKLAKEISQKKILGELHLLVGNPEAYKKNVRYIDTDLNRLFNENHMDMREMDNPNNEQKRAIEIGLLLENVDFLLDIHSTSKPSVPFLYIENSPKHRQLASKLEIEMIVLQSKKFRPKELFSSTDSFVDRRGGIGITYESGWQKDFSSFENVFENALRFLSAVGTVDFRKQKKTCLHQQYLEIYDWVVPLHNDFTLSSDYENFDFVSANETLAYEQNRPIIASQDSYIIFPKKNIVINSPACCLAKKHDKTLGKKEDETQSCC